MDSLHNVHFNILSKLALFNTKKLKTIQVEKLIFHFLLPTLQKGEKL